MSFSSWVRLFRQALLGVGRIQRSRPHRKRGCSRHVLPILEILEDRTVPSTFTVKNLNDSGPDSLRAAIASGDSTIVFKAGLHGVIPLTSGDLSITTGVTINGSGADRIAVSGDHLSRVFETAAGINVSISGLTITDGYAEDNGGGILNDGSNLTLSADHLTQNQVYGDPTNLNHGADGGAILSSAGILTISDCQITANQARRRRPICLGNELRRRALYFCG